MFSPRALVALAVLLAPPAARAQAVPARSLRPSIAFIGIDGIAAIPQGQFADYVGTGWGAGANLVIKLGSSPLALRVDGGWVRYGNETKRVCISTCRITADVHTHNDIYLFGIGPQLMAPGGSIRPYVTGTVGLSYFVTGSSIEGTNDDAEFASTKNFDDVTFAWAGGGGFYVPVRAGPRPIAIDLGVRYHGSGDASYLRKGSIIDHPDGSISFTPIRSSTHLLVAQVGVSIGL